MRYMRLMCVMILAVSVLAPTAWSQKVPTAAELDEAVETVRATMDSKRSGVRNFKSRLMSARRVLAGNLDQSMGRVTTLLEDEEPQMRLNAAIILAEAAKGIRNEQIDPALLAAMGRCLEEDNPAVAYWGLQGFMAAAVPPEEQAEAIESSLNLKRPRLVRLAAARLAGEKKLRGALPALVAHMQQILPSYTVQVESLLTYEVEVDDQGRPLRADTGSPGYAGRDRSGEGARTGRAVETPGMGGTGSAGGRAGGLGGGMGGRTPGIGRATSTASSTRRAPSTTRRGGLGARGEEEILVEKRLLDPDTLGIQDVVRVIQDLQDLPSVYELHEIGYIVELLAADNNPRAMPFGEDGSFVTAPPWALAACVEAAVVWIDENRAEFPNAPVPVKKPAAAETEKAPAPEDGEESAPSAENAAPAEGEPES